MKREARGNATALVVNYVKTAIQRGELKIGDKMPSEHYLTEKLGLGRSSLRKGDREGCVTAVLDHIDVTVNHAKNLYR